MANNIEYYQKQINAFYENQPEKVKRLLQNTLEEIKLLESIYMTGGANNFFSQQFKDAALKERQELCLKSSACYSILREQSKIPV
jgi:hypothetical protein